jgi:hypothetical protein
MRLVLLLLAALLLLPPAAAQPRWRTAYVVDARLAALRTAPDLAAPLMKRLRTGRRLAVVSRRRDRDGVAWVRVAVTRRTRGWLLEDAVASPGDADGERRLGERLAALADLPRLEAARLAADRFPRLRALAVEVMRVEGEAAASTLTARAIRRLGALGGEPPARVRALMLSDPALDRYNRLGLLFEADPLERRFRYSGHR